MTTHEPAFTVGDMVRAERNKRRLTQRALAERAGVSPLTVRFIETGRSSPRLSTLTKLAEAMRCPVARLVPAAAA